MEPPANRAEPELADMPRISQLPPEMLDMVLANLDLESIKNARLTSRLMAARCMGRTFKSYFETVELDLHSASFERLFDIVAHPALSSAIKTLVVVAVHYDEAFWRRLMATEAGQMPQSDEQILSWPPGRESHEAVRQLQWMIAKKMDMWPGNSGRPSAATRLKNLFGQLRSVQTLKLTNRHIRHNGKLLIAGELRTQLQISCIDNKILWDDCRAVFNMVITAMGLSNLAVDHLSIFDGRQDGKVHGPDYFAAGAATAFNTGSLLQRPSFARAGVHLKSLTLNFSTYDASETPLEDTTPDFLGRRPWRTISWGTGGASGGVAPNFPGVATFLRRTPNLEELVLSMCDTLETTPREHKAVFEFVSTDVHLPRLKRLSLRGMWLTGAALLRFLRRHPDIVELDLREIHLLDVAWREVFERLSGRGLNKLHLENLWAEVPFRDGLQNLAPVDKAFDDGKRGPWHSYPLLHGGDMVYARDIGREELQKGLEFVRLNKIPRRKIRGKGSKALIHWITQRKRLYSQPRIQPYTNDWDT